MARLLREITITEKIDGTNSTIYIDETGEIFAGSRNRWITPQNDNHGFAKWVKENADELKGLGQGLHRGEWWGSGIQRGYELKEKRFSLFNALRWAFKDDPIGVASTSWNDQTRQMEQKLQERAPACCHVVPVLYRGLFSTERVQFELDALHDLGSRAAPDFKNPEGVVVFHIAGNTGFKVTLDHDDEPKGKH